MIVVDHDDSEMMELVLSVIVVASGQYSQSGVDAAMREQSLNVPRYARTSRRTYSRERPVLWRAHERDAARVRGENGDMNVVNHDGACSEERSRPARGSAFH